MTAAWNGHDSVMLTFMAWGMTGNEPTNKGLVCFLSTQILFSMSFTVSLHFKTPHTTANLTRSSCWALAVLTRTRSVTTVIQRWMTRSTTKKSKACAHCSSSTLTRARRRRMTTHRPKSLRCLNNTSDVQWVFFLAVWNLICLLSLSSFYYVDRKKNAKQFASECLSNHERASTNGTLTMLNVSF